jgi:hypothetical protein
MKKSLVLLIILLPALTATPAFSLGSQAIFERHENAVFQIRVINRDTDKKSSIGSGFIYATDRTLVTNYHVVSSYIEEPGSFDLRYQGANGRSGSLQLVAVDAVHDLALVRADNRLGEPLTTSPPPAKGAALYAMGNPLDLGLTIAAGTNGGVLDQTDDSRILFSGSLNPGMSGGPTFDDTGAVVGVNVSTARNDISFIVPTDYLAPLVDQEHDGADDLLAAISRQILDYQSDYIDRMLERRWPTTELRAIRVPGAISPTVRCWDASPKTKPDRLYTQLAVSCKNENEIYLTDKIDVGKLLYEFVWLESDSLESFRFARLYKALNNSQFGGRARKDDVSRFDCETEFVAVTGMTLKTTVCRRDYLRYEGLSDVLVTAALVGHQRKGFIFNLDLSGTDAGKANQLLTRFLEEIAWPD